MNKNFQRMNPLLIFMTTLYNIIILFSCIFKFDPESQIIHFGPIKKIMKVLA
jgi:hypothetical protein